MRIVSLINQKGGCGKTTTAVNLSACLAHYGKKVLLIDLDPQGHASLALGVCPEDVPVGMASVLSQEASLEEILVKGVYPGLDLAPATLRLAALEQELSGLPQREERLLSALRRLRTDYDTILIDSPPSLGLLSFNALSASDDVLVPVDMSAFSLHGLSRLLETLEALQLRTGQTIEVWALPTLLSRTRFAQEIVGLLTEQFSGKFKVRRYQTMIRNTIRLREAARRGVPIVRYAPDSIGTEDYGALADEILRWEATMTQGIRESSQGLPPGMTLVEGGAVFTWEGSEDVAISGEFNNWVPDRKVYSLLNENNKIQKWVPLSPGRYAYRLRIDGVWRQDPLNPLSAEGPFDGRNSILELKESGAEISAPARSEAVA